MIYTFEMIKFMMKKTYTEYLTCKWGVWRSGENKVSSGVTIPPIAGYGETERNMLGYVMTAYQSDLDQWEMNTLKRLCLFKFYELYKKAGGRSGSPRSESAMKVSPISEVF
jgi:hypothetical protein